MLECLEVLLQAFNESDAVGKLIVVALGFVSVWANSIIIVKAYSVCVIRMSCARFMRKSSKGTSPLLLEHSLSEDEEMPMDSLCRTGLAALQEVIKRSGSREEFDALVRRQTLLRPLTPAELDMVRNKMVRQMNTLTQKLDNMMILLGTFVQIAPFTGLFGTVWGVMMVFFQMGMSGGRAEISEMAPGVSSALLTTVAGLVVAIPALIANNVLTAYNDATVNEMEIFIDNFIANLQLEETVEGGTSPVRIAGISGEGGD